MRPLRRRSDLSELGAESTVLAQPKRRGIIINKKLNYIYLLIISDSSYNNPLLLKMSFSDAAMNAEIAALVSKYRMKAGDMFAKKSEDQVPLMAAQAEEPVSAAIKAPVIEPVFKAFTPVNYSQEAARFTPVDFTWNPQEPVANNVIDANAQRAADLIALADAATYTNVSAEDLLAQAAAEELIAEANAAAEDDSDDDDDNVEIDEEDNEFPPLEEDIVVAEDTVDDTPANQATAAAINKLNKYQKATAMEGLTGGKVDSAAYAAALNAAADAETEATPKIVENPLANFARVFAALDDFTCVCGNCNKPTELPTIDISVAAEDLAQFAATKPAGKKFTQKITASAGGLKATVTVNFTGSA